MEVGLGDYFKESNGNDSLETLVPVRVMQYVYPRRSDLFILCAEEIEPYMV